MSAKAITKEQYLDELAGNAALKIASAVPSEIDAVPIMMLALKKVIVEELTPILRLIG